MAKMFPNRVNDYEFESNEDIAFDKLEKLPKDYYIFHSFKIHRFTEDNFFIRRQCDFILFHPELGVLCFECKNWDRITEPKFYKKAFKKSESFANELLNIFTKHKIEGKDLKNICKISYATCILNKTEKDFREECKALPDEDSYRLIVFLDELEDPVKLENKIKKIMSANLINANTGKPVKMDPKPELVDQIINFLKWKFSLYSAINDECLNLEQLTVLDIMTYQPIMAVYGFAGTGKTVLALQKARMEAADNNTVLYLCSTPLMAQKLREMLDNTKIFEGIKNKFILKDIDSLKEEWKLDGNDDNTKIENELTRLIPENKSKNKNALTVIVDEGQDFGTTERECLLTGIFNYVATGNVKSSDDVITMLPVNRKGNFYIFYDQLQLFKGKKLPGIISKIDCRIPLIRNCRNTKRIAESAFSPIWGEVDKIKYGPRAEKGELVEWKYCGSDQDILSYLDDLLKMSDKDKTETVILTAKDNVQDSVLFNGRKNKILKNGSIWKYRPFEDVETAFMFTSVSDYKGLECNQIIFLDFVPNEFVVEDSDSYKRLYYTAISRAIKDAKIIVNNSDSNKFTRENIEKSRLPKTFRDCAMENQEKRGYDTPRINAARGVNAKPVY